MSQNATVNVDIKLGVNKFHVDEGPPAYHSGGKSRYQWNSVNTKACPADFISRMTPATFILILPVVWVWPVGCCAVTLFSNSGIIRRHLRY